MNNVNRFFRTPINHRKTLKCGFFIGGGDNSDLDFSFKKNKNCGFSLVELIVVITIMAVMVLVLAPALLQYNERSRAEKDNKAMDEVVGAIQLAIADPAVYDELLPYSTPDNISCYVDTDSEANYQAIITKINPDGVNQYTFDSTSRQLDETPYYAAGNMRGVTITFAPNKGSNGSIYDLKQGVVNQYVQVSGNQRVGALPELYNQLRSVVGDTIINDSSTYRNSEYTIFIRFGTTGGNDASKQDAIVAYGQWSGSNLPAEVSYKLVSDRTVGDTGNTIVINDNKWNSENGNKITVNPGDLNGGGSFTPGTETGNQTDSVKNGIQGSVPDELVGVIYAYILNRNTLVLRSTPREDTEGVTSYAIMNSNGDRCWSTFKYVLKKVIVEEPIAPIRCDGWFEGCSSVKEFQNMDMIDTSHVTSMDSMFYGAGSGAASFEMDLSTWDVSNVTDMAHMFHYAGQSSTTWSVGDISKWDVSNVTSMMYMFSNVGTNADFSLDLSGWNASKNPSRFAFSDGIKIIPPIWT